jgi:hypothetical protein
MPDPEKTNKLENLALRLYFSLIVPGGILAITGLLCIPVDKKNPLIFGLSAQRWILILGVLLITLAAIWLLIRTYIHREWFFTFKQRLNDRLKQRHFWTGVLLLCTAGVISSSYFLLLTPEISDPFTQAYFVRLNPLLWWAAVLSAQTLILLPLLRYQFDLRALKPCSKTAYLILGIFGFFLLIWLFVARTGFGITDADAGAGWYYLGTPILETQVLLVWIITLLYLTIGLRLDRHPALEDRLNRFRILRTDLIFSILIWLVAFLLWNSIPLAPSWFAAPPSYPNLEYYPNSDAITYDSTAQSVMVGVGFKTYNAPFAVRPLYALFLAVLHTLASPDYESIIGIQVAILALIPVLLYWLTKDLHNRISAIIAALLITLREANAITLGEWITVSHAKLLMSDLPTTLGVLLFLLLIIQWLRTPDRHSTLPLIAGGVTGAFMLIRPEFGVLLPFVGLLALLHLGKQPKSWFRGMLLIAAGLVLMLTPWIWRNYQITGTIFIDSPYYRADLFAKRYQDIVPTPTPTVEPEGATNKPATILAKPASAIEVTPSATEASPAPAEKKSPTPTPTVVIAFQEGETYDQFADRLSGEAASYARQNPDAVLSFISNHFFNSTVQTVLYLPGSFRFADSLVNLLEHKTPERFWLECCSADDYIRRLPFWHKWDGKLPRQSFIPLILNLLVIATGIGVVWRENRARGLVPIAAAFGYYLINAVVRNSGGRYILPVDWIGILYFSIGLGQITLWVVAYLRGSVIPPQIEGEPRIRFEAGSPSKSWLTALGIAVLILLIGCLLPITEKAYPERYPQDQVFTTLVSLTDPSNESISAEDRRQIQAVLRSRGTTVLGRALYPRFHRAGEGEVGSTIPAFYPRDFRRVSFYLVGPLNSGVVLPTERKPEVFPHASDVLIIGCPGEDYFDAGVLVIFNEDGTPLEVLSRSPMEADFSCP